MRVSRILCVVYRAEAPDDRKRTCWKSRIHGMKEQIKSAVEAAEICVRLAEEAARAGTFGVGALLVHASGTVLACRQNQVLQFGELNDPTAHAERLIIDWYYDQLNLDTALPPPDECTIVTSLDPCIHCAAAILLAGFKAASLAPDDTAGIFARPRLQCLPAGLREQASRAFSRLQVEGHRTPELIREVPFDPRPLSRQAVPEILHDRARSAFLNSLKTTRLAVSGGQGGPRQSSTKTEFGGIEGCLVGVFDAHMLRRIDLVLRQDAGDFAAFLDPASRMAFGAFDQKSRSPLRLAFVELTRQFAKYRRSGAPMSHPKDCILLTKSAPGPDCEGLLTIGAYGSTMETELPPSKHDKWICMRPNGVTNDWIGELPPLYSEIIAIAPTPLNNSTFVNLDELLLFMNEPSPKTREAQASQH
jgi:tRNA(Arg) A34 adenosine deaminase TadA